MVIVLPFPCPLLQVHLVYRVVPLSYQAYHRVVEMALQDIALSTAPLPPLGHDGLGVKPLVVVLDAVVVLAAGAVVAAGVAGHPLPDPRRPA